MGYKKIEHYDEECTKSLSSNYKEVIVNLGEDPSREGLLKTCLLYTSPSPRDRG